ncbi:efflux RND transporter permease subunit, partial [Acinetobacter baumannii]|uniref:efflux RND transporter permease subunit n=2 Tax=Gammaproteobacteria TaxID=1236 RepID=UPI0013D3BBFC
SNFFLYRWFNSGFHGLSHGYAASVQGLVRLRWLVLVLFAIVIAVTYWISTRIPSTFLPVEDQGYFFAVVQLPDGASLERTDAVSK